MFTRLLLILLTLLSAAPAAAWGDYGHRTVATIATAEMSPAARAAVDRILGEGYRLRTPGCPLATLGDAAVWPDCVRGLGDRFAFAAPWHYQNISVCRDFNIAANCKGGNCITAQIRRQLAIVANPKSDPAQRVMALAFLTHFVGDLHMPLHVGEKNDRGGNDVRVVYAGLAGDKINLHRIWDRELAERALQASPPVTPASITPEARAAWSQGSLADWTRQSWALSRSVTYVGLPALADGCLGPRDTNVVVPIPDAYATAALPVIRMQVERAGVRLGVLLDRALR